VFLAPPIYFCANRIPYLLPVLGEQLAMAFFGQL